MILKELIERELTKYEKTIDDIIWIGTDEFHITLDNFKELCETHISFVLMFPIGFKLVFDNFSLFISEEDLKYSFKYEENENPTAIPNKKIEMKKWQTRSQYIENQGKDNPINGVWILSCKII